MPNDSFSSSQLISVREACLILSVGKTTLYKLIKLKKLTLLKLTTRSTRLRLTEVHALIDSLTVKGEK